METILADMELRRLISTPVPTPGTPNPSPGVSPLLLNFPPPILQTSPLFSNFPPPMQTGEFRYVDNIVRQNNLYEEHSRKTQQQFLPSYQFQLQLRSITGVKVV